MVETVHEAVEVESIDEEIAENQHVRIEVTSASDSDSLHLPEGDDDSEPEVPSGPRPKRLSDLNLKEKTIPMPNASSLFCLGNNNVFRKAAHKIGTAFFLEKKLRFDWQFEKRWAKVNLNVFTNIILACIVFSSITLAIEDPIDEHRNAVVNLIKAFVSLQFTTAAIKSQEWSATSLRLLLHDDFHRWNCAQSYQLRCYMP